MHEISLVKNLFSTLHAEFSDEEIVKIKTIKLKIGLLSNVEPQLMQNAFAAVTATENPEFVNSILHITTMDIKVLCAHCNSESIIKDYRFICLVCQMPTGNVIQGNELLIEGVEIS